MNTQVRGERCAVALGLWPRKGIPSHAFAVIKQTYDVSTGQAQPIVPEELGVDPADRQPGFALAPGNDHALFKPKTDVIVLGSAYPSRPMPTARVRVCVGTASVAIDVIGHRVAQVHGDRVQFSAPEPFEDMAMVVGNAYGGIDPEVEAPPPASLGALIAALADHPGIYPRNPHGKGYAATLQTADGLELPNLESPTDRLTPQRFVCDPSQWWRQPRPAFLGWSMGNQFCRSVAMQSEPWFPAPDDDRLPEVADGHLPRNYRSSAEWTDGTCLRRFHQEAPPALQCAGLGAGAPIEIAGMRRDQRRVAFRLPPPPSVGLVLDGHILTDHVQLTAVAVRPAEHRVTLTWLALAEPSRRVFIPGVHGAIPLGICVDTEAFAYQTPTPRTQIASAAASAQESPQ